MLKLPKSDYQVQPEDEAAQSYDHSQGVSVSKFIKKRTYQGRRDPT